MKRKAVGIAVIVLFAAALVFGAVGSVLEVVDATTPAPVDPSDPANPSEGDYVARLTTEGGSEDPALAALKYICPFH